MPEMVEAGYGAVPLKYSISTPKALVAIPRCAQLVGFQNEHRPDWRSEREAAVGIIAQGCVIQETGIGAGTAAWARNPTNR
jgi:hypothetical protein